MGKRLIIAAIVIALGAGVSYFRGDLILRAASSLGLIDRPVAARNTLAKAKELAKPTPAQEAASRLAASDPASSSAPAANPKAAAAPAKTAAPARATSGAAVTAKSPASATAAKATPAAKSGNAPATATAAKPAAPAGVAKPGSPAGTSKAASAAAPATALAKAPAAAPQVGQKTGATRAASPAGRSQAAGGTVMASSGFAAEPFLDPTDKLSGWVREPYHYTRLGRRDPFGSLLSGEFVADGEPGLVDIGDMKLVGIAWDQSDRFAMVEDSRGFGYALRQGDPIRNGRVMRIDRKGVTFVQSMAGESSTVTIELPIQEGK
jgi:hypothetical protein